MYLMGSLLVGLILTLFLVSKIATMLHAKKPGMERIFLASMVGMIAAVITLIPLGMFVTDIDPNVMLMLTVFIVFLVSSLAFKYINVMTWGGAITTNIASIVLSLITVTAAVVLNGGSIDETIKTASNTFKSNASMVGVPIADDSMVENDGLVEEELSSLDDDEYEPTFKEKDLLPDATVKELEAKERKVYKAPKYHVISISNIRSAVGKNIRILNKNGNSIKGALKNIQGNDAVVEQRLGGGLAITPISLAKIQKIEVYR